MRFWGSLAVSAVLFATNVLAGVADPAVQRATAVRDRFFAAIGECGATVPFIPDVVVETAPSLVSFDGNARKVYVSRFAELGPGVQAMMTAWAAQGTLGLDAGGQFGEIFNELLVAHELGHNLQFVSGRLATLDEWQSETEANVIALAFWSHDPSEVARVPQRVENFSRFLLSVPNPVPAGADPHTYFVSHYRALGDDAAAYGWFQGRFMQMAADSKEDFCTWVKRNQPKL